MPISRARSGCATRPAPPDRALTGVPLDTESRGPFCAKKQGPDSVVIDKWAANARLPYSDRQMQLLAKVHGHYAKYGLGGNSLTLRAVLGREPRSLRCFIRELAQQTAHAA